MSITQQIQASELEAANEIVVTLGEYRFTRAELLDSFNEVASQENWKNPVNAYAVFRTPRDRIAMHAAVQFFTGSTATLELVGTAGDTAAYKVTAPGYYRAVGA